MNMIDNYENVLTYEPFMLTHSCPVQFKGFHYVIKAIPLTLQLVKSIITL